MELIGLPEVAELLHISRKRARMLLSKPGCPVLPRQKWEHFLVPKEALIRWLDNGCPSE